ncbi:MAG TPA: YihA family ribosome biogenesis GTP-binding protein [Microscillaceae bacterium]|nr:YihA family ribosome biogenesis GTP-binding protein [Microscillaceae bacterium]
MQAQYISSNTDYKKCPEPTLPEYAFIGRSNVGKSSLINALIGQKLAHTSQQPGKTKLISHFLVNKFWYLVDLPGYGWAKVSKTERAKWEKMIKNYLLKRENLYNVFLLIDTRHEPQAIDLNFMRWLAEAQVPFCLVFTKADKLTKTQAQKRLDVYFKKLKEDWEEIPPHFVTSSVNGNGMEGILDYIAQINTAAEQKT